MVVEYSTEARIFMTETERRVLAIIMIIFVGASYCALSGRRFTAVATRDVTMSLLRTSYNGPILSFVAVYETVGWWPR
jgi:hypothetical protein